MSTPSSAVSTLSSVTIASNRTWLGLVAAFLAAAGAYLIYTSVAFGWRGRGPGISAATDHRRRSLRVWMVEAGLGEVGTAEFIAAEGVVLVGGAIGAYVIFGGFLPALAGGCFAASFPVSAYRGRRRARLAEAREAWPRVLEELRLRTGSLGRSIPQAVFEAGRHAPADWRQGFAAAEREWLLTTDFPRTMTLLKERLADPTVDTVCETLIVAHELGGADLDTRLAELIDDRVLDLQGRKDADSRQAGVRFARRFVLVVPLGMALAGLAIGTGRSAYETLDGQIAVVVGLAAVAGCWIWSGRIMRLPNEPRVFP